jgi:transposase
MSPRRYELTDFEWSIIAPLLPNRPRGVARADDRKVLNGIYWRLRTGSPYGPSTTCYNRFVRWRKIGVWDTIFAAVSTAYDGDLQMIDSSSISEKGRQSETEPRHLTILETSAATCQIAPSLGVDGVVPRHSRPIRSPLRPRKSIASMPLSSPGPGIPHNLFETRPHCDPAKASRRFARIRDETDILPGPTVRSPRLERPSHGNLWAASPPPLCPSDNNGQG